MGGREVLDSDRTPSCSGHGKANKEDSEIEQESNISNQINQILLFQPFVDCQNDDSLLNSGIPLEHFRCSILRTMLYFYVHDMSPRLI